MALGTKRSIYRAHVQILGRQEWVEDGTGIVHHWMQENYRDSMMIGLRRVLDKNRRSFSLIKLLEELEKNSPLLALARYSDLCRRAKAIDSDTFIRLLYSPFSSDGRTFDRRRIRADIEALLKDHADLRRFIDGEIAHRRAAGDVDADGHGQPELTWADLDRLFDDVTALFNKYYTLVDPGTLVDFESVLPAGFARAFERMLTSQVS